MIAAEADDERVALGRLHRPLRPHVGARGAAQVPPDRLGRRVLPQPPRRPPRSQGEPRSVVLGPFQ